MKWNFIAKGENIQVSHRWPKTSTDLFHTDRVTNTVRARPVYTHKIGVHTKNRHKKMMALQLKEVGGL